MKALVTGIAGFAGNYLAQLLSEEGIELYGISTEQDFKPFLPLDASAVRYLSLDVRDRPRLGEFLSEVRPDLIFHLAARSSPSESRQHPEETYSINFGGTLAILEALRVYQIKSRLLLVSSSHVYGSGSPAGPVTEDSSLRPETPYAASKAAAEMAAYQYWNTYGIETIRVRAFNHTGPGQQPGFVCPDLACKVVAIERGQHAAELAVTNPDHCMDFSDVRDVVRGYYSALTLGLPGEVYNLCSQSGVTVRLLADSLAAKARIGITVVSRRPASPSKEGGGLIGDSSRARRDLQWKASIPFQRTLSDVLEYSRHQDQALSQTNPSVPEKNTPVALT